MRFSPMAFSIGLSILKTREDAEDLVQDLFAHKVPRLLRERPDLSQEELGRVLAVAARNLCIDRYRRRRRFPESELDPDIHAAGPEAAPGSEDGDRLDAEVLFADLKPKYREVLTLKYLWELTWEEVAARLGLSQAGARKRADLARKDILARHSDGNSGEAKPSGAKPAGDGSGKGPTA
jgi:RNA polymerase sigma-70 factor, ECF subfamily